MTRSWKPTGARPPGVRPALEDRRARLVAAAHDISWLHLSDGSNVDLDLEAMDGELVTDSLVYRYDPAASPDGLRGSGGTFSLCTFSYVDSLARAGQLEKARNTFEKMLTYANHLGLYSEEIALTGSRLATFHRHSLTWL